MELTIRYRVASIMKLNGFGSAVIQRLVKTNVKKNLYFEIKEKVIEESFNGFRVNKNKALVKVYGLDSTKDVRARLIEILYDRVRYHKDKFIAPILYEEMKGMEVKRTGKVEHSDNTHDDQVFSYLMALYVWYDGKNVAENFNLMKNTIKTDEDIEIIAGDIEADKNIETVDISDMNDENDIVSVQTEYISQDTSKLQVEYNMELHMKEEQQLSYMMATDKVAKAAYEKAFNMEPSILNNQRELVMLPEDVFADDFDGEISGYNRVDNGNLFNMWNK